MGAFLGDFPLKLFWLPEGKSNKPPRAMVEAPCALWDLWDLLWKRRGRGRLRKSQTEGCQDVGLVSENGVNWVEPIWTPYGPNGDSKLNDFNDLAT
jgi:hypothetical protein